VTANVETWSPTALDHALQILAARSDQVTVLAGGTDLMVQLGARTVQPKAVLDIWALDELRGISEEPEHIVIGALDSYTDIINSPLVQEFLPTLVESAKTIGAVQIQNRGTLGGNLGNASPAADTPPVLIAADATIQLASASGRREVPIDRFFLGYRKVDMRPDELVVSVRCRKKTAAHRDWFRKVGTRRAQAISKVVLAGRIRLADDGSLADVRLSAGSIAPTTVRLPQSEQAMTGCRPSAQLAAEVARTAQNEIVPIDDVRSTADYRARVTGSLIARWITTLASEIT
jgi:CO/xanthine dehydrogenase FAD-binding subunit